MVRKDSVIGIIGGSGLYSIEGLKVIKEVRLKTPFGRPSDKYTLAEMQGKKVIFLPRHGRHHTISPSMINYRANIYGFKYLGAEKIISVSACGSLKDEIKPLDFVVPDQFIDRTNQARKSTFFSQGAVAHIGFSHPVCPDLAKVLYKAAKKAGVRVHLAGTYINIEGPAFSTLAESKLYRKWGADIIGMTNIAEAKLAREAEMCYATLAAVTDYDCWHKSHKTVTADMVIKNLTKNVQNAKKILKFAVGLIGKTPSKCSCSQALKYSLVTRPEYIPARTKQDLKIIIGKYL